MYKCTICGVNFGSLRDFQEHTCMVDIKPDLVNHPPHYTSHPSGVECIQITEHMNFNLGNAFKYIWRAGEKGDHLTDLKKARWYLDREIQRLEKANAVPRNEVSATNRT